MHIGILQCDDVLEKFLPHYGHYPDMFIRLLLKADPTFTFSVYDVRRSHFPSHRTSCDAYLITGSRHGVNDPLPWISDLELFIRDLHASSNKMIGICFGHQLIAKALGGSVDKSPKGWAVGLSQNKIVEKKNWMIPVSDTFQLLVSHQEQVVKLPPGAEVIASNDNCPFYMMQLANSLSLQGHPEFSKAYVRSLIEDRKDRLSMRCYEDGLQSLTMDNDTMLTAQWMTRFFLT